MHCFIERKKAKAWKVGARRKEESEETKNRKLGG